MMVMGSAYNRIYETETVGTPLVCDGFSCQDGTELRFQPETVTFRRPFMTNLRNFVNGEYVDPKDGGYADLIDPTSGATFASAPVSGAADVDAAMSAAATAFESWRDST